MRTLTALYIFSLCKFCNAGWPCCLRCNRSDDEDQEGFYTPESKSEESPQTPSIPHPLDSLDLSNPEKGIIHTTETDNGEVKQKYYFPRVGVHIITVFDINQILWTNPTGDKEECLFAEYYEKGNSIILALNLVRGDEFIPKYFERHNAVWKEIKKKTYFRRLNVIKFGSGQTSG